MKKGQLCGKEFNIVNEVSEEVLHKMAEVIQMYESTKGDLRAIDTILEYLSNGACGRVYILNEDYVLKVNNSGYGNDCRDGEILADLQGLPFIPTLYMYSTDNKFMIVQRIKGVTVNEYTGEFPLPYEWDQELFAEEVEKVDRLYRKQGWLMYDVHANNCMIDKEGNFWIVDVGLFNDIKRLGKDANSDKFYLKMRGHEIQEWATFEDKPQESLQNPVFKLNTQGHLTLRPKKSLPKFTFKKLSMANRLKVSAFLYHVV